MSRLWWFAVGWLGCQAPAADDPVATPALPRFSEVNVRPAPLEHPFVCDWIELDNPSDESLDLSGFSLTEDVLVPRMWSFPEGARLAAAGRLVVLTPNCLSSAESAAAAADYPFVEFQLDRAGESLHLFAPGEAGEPAASVRWGPSPVLSVPAATPPIHVEWTAWARVPDVEDTWRWTTSPTPEAPNVIEEFDTGFAP